MKQRKGIDRRLDDAWSLLVKLKAGMKCEYCGKLRILTATIFTHVLKNQLGGV